MILKYFFAWFGMMVLAIINGGVRDLVYASYVGSLPAHQISTVVLLVLFAGYFWFLTRIWPMKSAKQAWILGGIWFLMTEIFEFGIGLIGGGILEQAPLRLQYIRRPAMDIHSIMGAHRPLYVLPLRAIKIGSIRPHSELYDVRPGGLPSAYVWKFDTESDYTNRMRQ